MSEYTPTTEEVREALIDRRDFQAQVAGSERHTDDESGQAFDRWLAGVERAAAARALDLAASDWAADPDAWGDNEKDYRNELRARAAEIRGAK